MAEGNVLKFALGIETAEFVRGLGEGSHKVFEFLAITELGTKALEKFTEAFKRGATLWDNHFALNSTVASLYQLESAFTAVHLPGEEAKSMSLRLQRSLSGVSETGERTENTFASLGLSMQELKRLNPVEQFTKVAEALGDVNAAVAPGLASNLFGRFNYGQVLQIARQQDKFKEGFEGGKGGADIFAQLAKPMTEILVTWNEIQEKMEVAWAAASKGFIVPFQHLLTTIKNFPWQKIGEDAGVIIGGLLEAFREGKLALLIGETFNTGFQLALIYGADMFVRLGIEMLNIFAKAGLFLAKVFETPINYLQAGLSWAVKKAIEEIAKIPGVGKLLGIQGIHPGTFAQELAEAKKTDPIFGIPGNSIGNMNEMVDMAVAAMRQISNANLGADTKTAMAPLLALLQKFQFFNSRGPQLPVTKDEQMGDLPASSSTAQWKSSANAMEKIGFIFNTAGNASQDYLRRSANGIERLVAIFSGRTGAIPTLNMRNRA